MNRYSAALAALFAVRLILPISAGSAQIAPGDVEMPTGDVWPSREERIYIPQNALVPNRVNGEAKDPAPSDPATPKAKNTPSQGPSPVPERAITAPVQHDSASVNLKTIYTDPRFWRLAPLAAQPRPPMMLPHR
jgi:hypothetical protein